MGPYDPLASFLPPVRRWFETTLGEPTAAQRLGWPAIGSGRHTLILAPTGSGKTLAAFLACLDGLWRQEPLPEGVQLLYVSPLKALNNDIYRNLRLPLEGVAGMAREGSWPLPEIRAAVRTGDTPPAERRMLLRRPPHVLITTPESLHLILTSQARQALRGVTHCIVDEIHALCPNKRGVFLALLLERLEALTQRPFVRIGLSATQRPLEEVAAFLGGREVSDDGQYRPRPVTVLDAGLRKDLDLKVISPVERFGPLPERSIWPSIYRLLREQVRAHRSTIIFANNRRTVERITAHLNEEAGGDGPAPLARAHHGSVALDVRRQTETALKEGRLPAVVATASLELGIDMGAVDLVCQVESPGSVARGLQRVGRAGHLVGRQSKGRLVPKTLPDLVEQAVLAREMAAGNVEAIRTPTNCLDVLAQQVVAMVSVEDWRVPDLYARIRRAHPYRDLTPAAFESVLEMVSGRFQPGGQAAGAPASLRPRISWDRVHNRLLALPGSRQLALVSGGTIPDTGQYAAYTTGGVRVGELDEEFIYERRVGDTFLLGTSSWRLERVDVDRVVLTPAQGVPAMVPFWKGEQAGRTRDLGLAIGRFLRELGGRLSSPDCVSWLESEFFLDPKAARNLLFHVRRQVEAAGCLPTDETLVIEASRDPLGDWQVLLLSPLGSRIHLALRLALEARLRERLGYGPQCLHHDDGILIRLADADEPVLDLLDGLAPENVEDLILGELADSALFAIRFRQNAGRALLLPRNQPGKRAPLWLQRLRGRDLLQVARQFRDFPIVAETFRECLHDHLDLPAVQALLAEVRDGRVRVVARRAESPSPFAAGLLFAYTGAFMYQDDRSGASGGAAGLDRELLAQLTGAAPPGALVDPRAVQQVEQRLRRLGQPPRSATEAAEWLRRVGDLAPAELEGPMQAFLEELEADGRAKRIHLPQVRAPERWVLAEDEGRYRLAFGLGGERPGADAQAAGEAVLACFLDTHALVGLQDVLDRYPFDADWARRRLEAWSSVGRLVPVPPAGEREPVRWSAPSNLERIRRGTLGILRREIVVCPPTQFADFLLRWQGLHPASRRPGPDGLRWVLERLEGAAVAADLWERTILPHRVTGYQRGWLDQWVAAGEGAWVGWGGPDGGPLDVRFLSRERVTSIAAPVGDDAPGGDEPSGRVVEALRRLGAAFVTDVARETGQPPSEVRAGLWALVRRGLVTNDSFEVVRRGESGGPGAEVGRAVRLSRRPRAARQPPEGRWSLLRWAVPDAESRVVAFARMLLCRYGVVAREVASLDPWMPSWRILYEVYSHLELTGEVRRGYFVEGLSGAQFALPEASRALQDLALPSAGAAPLVLVHSLDPSNLYGSGAPLDVPLLDGGTRPLARRTGNWLVIRAGRPVLIVEQQGKRLTALASASREEWAQAVGLLKGVLAPAGAARHKLTVEEWNGEPVTASPGRDLLEAAGFVPDYRSMTLYGAWT